MNKSKFCELIGISEENLDRVLMNEVKIDYDYFMNKVRIHMLKEKMNNLPTAINEAEIVEMSGYSSIADLNNALEKYENISLDDWILLRKSFVFYK